MKTRSVASLWFIGALGLQRVAAAQSVPAPEQPAADPVTAPNPGSAPVAPVAPVDASPPRPAPAPPPESAAQATPPPAHGEAHHEEVSPLVPEIHVTQNAARPIDPKIAYRPGRGLTIKSADGDFEMAIKFRAQILATFEANHEGEGETLENAQIRRARLAFVGHMFGKHNRYKMELAVSPRDDAMRSGTTVGTAPLLDWYMTFDYAKEAEVVVGQYKIPFNRQRVVSSGSLQMVDRSIVQNEFNLDRNVGLDVRSTSLLGGALHYYAGFYAGEGRNAFELHDANLVSLARIEVLPFGNFQDFVEADFERTGPRLSIGGSFAHVANSLRNQGPLGRAPADGGTTTYDTAEADLLVKMYGLSATGEFFWRDGERKSGGALDAMGMPIPTERPRNGTGFFAQVGYLLPQTMLEIEGRYGNIHGAGAESSLADRQELGGGVSYYFAQHTFKLQTDYFRLWGSNGLSEGMDQVRLQLEAGL